MTLTPFLVSNHCCFIAKREFVREVIKKEIYSKAESRLGLYPDQTDEIVCISAASHSKGLIFTSVMLFNPYYTIEGNTQAAAQGNSWQDGVNALVML